MSELDARMNVHRADLADEALRGQVQATQFVQGVARQVTKPIVSVLKKPQKDSPQTSQALMGETCLAFEIKNDFAWVKFDRDCYVGYVEASALRADIQVPTHKVIAPSTLLYPKADLKSSPADFLLRHTQMTVVAAHGQYVELQSGGFVFAKHLGALDHREKDFVAVAEEYLHAPYFWGGKSVHGIDCSGLVQTALQACGIEAPRDSDMQEKALGKVVVDHRHLRRGDLIFWQGHVGIMQNATHLIHANGHAMKTTSEPLADVVARSETPITSIKRLA
jgi:cell wall-associated NlpC family hydrolase